MTWTWTSEGTLLDAAVLGVLEPVEVLYDFDGPRVFTTLAPDGATLLAYVCDETVLGTRLLVVPTDQKTVDDVKSGGIALFTALNQPWVWLVERDGGGSPMSVRRIRLSDVPLLNLPRPGARLTGDEALVRIRLSGRGIGRCNVPASVARRGMDAVTTGLKSIFDHIVGRESFGRPREEFRRLYDLPVREFAFNSFEVVFGEPAAPSQDHASQGHLSLADIEESNLAVQKTAEAAAELLRRAIDWAESQTDAEPPDPDDATSLAMLRALEKLTPPQTGLVEKVELSGSLFDRSARRPATLTRAASKRVRAAITKATAEKEELISLTGVISEFDKDKPSFTLREIEGQVEDQKCVIDENLFDDAFEHFVDDARVIVVGRRTRGKSEVLRVLAIQPKPVDHE